MCDHHQVSYVTEAKIFILSLNPLYWRDKNLLPFFPKITNPLCSSLKKFNFHIVTRNQNATKDLLCNYKDKQKPLSTSGFYEVACKNCDLKYRGQSKRAIQDRLKEHCGATRNSQYWNSSVAKHMLEEQHEIDL